MKENKSAGHTGGGIKQIAFNRRAYYNYEVVEKIECGIVLQGSEVKSLKDGRVSFPDGWAEIQNGEVWLRQCVIAEYPFAALFKHEPERPKKLLLHKQEIKRLKRRVDEKGYTLTPLSFYLKGGKVKVELGVCKGKKQYDKRAVIRGRDLDREAAREMSNKIRDR
ncbi:MAG: SsrA-binding protein SmpB [Spirochaetaceae bacterium]|jgi:SsrA-binding protein|nr:SsrA-binding protein SmpB [Spirochaetaceae bacterium]